MRKLGELRAFIENLPENKTFRFSLDGPFSWRGSYQEVGFCIVRRECSKKELLEVVNYAFTGIFEGYKGGEYTYDEETRINFENDDSCYTAGGYINSIAMSLMFGELYPVAETFEMQTIRSLDKDGHFDGLFKAALQGLVSRASKENTSPEDIVAEASKIALKAFWELKRTCPPNPTDNER